MTASHSMPHEQHFYRGVPVEFWAGGNDMSSNWRFGRVEAQGRGARKGLFLIRFEDTGKAAWVSRLYLRTAYASELTARAKMAKKNPGRKSNIRMPAGIRPASGKVGSILDGEIYTASLRWRDGIAGDLSADFGDINYSARPRAALLLDGVKISRWLQAHPPSPYAEQLNKTELRFLREEGKAGVILFEDGNDGPVVVNYYSDRRELDRDWEKAVEDLSIESED